MPGNAAVKSTARVIMKKLWPQLIACTFLIMACFFVGIYALSAFGLLLGDNAVFASLPFLVLYILFVAAPFVYGALRFVWRAGDDSGDDVGLVFYYFASAKRYFKSVRFTVGFLLRIALMLFLAHLPQNVVKVALYAASGFLNEQMRLQFSFVVSLLGLLGLVLFVILSTRYYIAPLLFVGCDHLENAEVIHMSKLISRKTAGAYIVLVLGMIGWMLLSLLGITLIYTAPYFLAAYTVHCRYAVYHYNHLAKISGETDFPAFRSSF